MARDKKNQIGIAGSVKPVFVNEPAGRFMKKK
jgi:hypothetical protein